MEVFSDRPSGLSGQAMAGLWSRSAFIYMAQTTYFLRASPSGCPEGVVHREFRNERLMNIAVFLPNWLGDLVMATPTLRALRRHFGDQARIIGIMRPYLADVLAGTSWLDEQWFYHPKSKDPRQRHWGVIRRMHRIRLDMALLLPNSLRTAVLARLGGARERIGYSRYGRGPLLTRKLDSPRVHGQIADSPMVDYYLRLAEAVGCPPESRRLGIGDHSGRRTVGRLRLGAARSARGRPRAYAQFRQLQRRRPKLWPRRAFRRAGPPRRRGVGPRRAGDVRPEGTRHRPGDRRSTPGIRGCSRWPISRSIWARRRRASAAAG